MDQSVIVVILKIQLLSVRGGYLSHVYSVGFIPIGYALTFRSGYVGYITVIIIAIPSYTIGIFHKRDVIKIRCIDIIIVATIHINRRNGIVFSVNQFR